MWRSGLFVLAVYAMLLQAFFGAVVGAAQAHPGSAFGLAFDGSALCVGASGAPDAPSPASHDQSCVCAASCHFSGLWVASMSPAMRPPALASVRALAPASSAFALRVVRATPPARGPPHDVIRPSS